MSNILFITKNKWYKKEQILASAVKAKGGAPNEYNKTTLHSKSQWGRETHANRLWARKKTHQSKKTMCALGTHRTQHNSNRQNLKGDAF